MAKRALLVAPGNVYSTILSGYYEPLTFSGFNIERINRKLINKQWTVTTFQDEQATIANVESFFSKSAANDEVLFYYSGHGDVFSGPEADGKDEVLVLYDKKLENATLRRRLVDFSLTDDRLTEIIQSHIDNHINFNLVLDCCHAGGMVDNMEAKFRSEPRFTIFAGSTERSLAFADMNSSFFTEALLMAANATSKLQDMRQSTVKYLKQLFIEQRSVIQFDPSLNNNDNFI
jgi:hypothetical protein